MSVLAEVVDAAGPSLEPYAARDPGEGRFDAPADRRFVLEAVYEGYLMHYGEPRAFAGMDDDLRLLAGDALYALGLSRLVETGDVGAVAELSDLISLSAQAHAEGRAEVAEELWRASANVLSGRPGTGAREAARDRLSGGS